MVEGRGWGKQAHHQGGAEVQVEEVTRLYKNAVFADEAQRPFFVAHDLRHA